jgi:hypothetical protein
MGHLFQQKFRSRDWYEYVMRLVMKNFLLRLPSTYFSRVRRLFAIAEVTKGEVQKMIQERESGIPIPSEFNADTVSPSVYRLSSAWDQFIDSLIKEWKTLNIVSALLTT